MEMFPVFTPEDNLAGARGLKRLAKRLVLKLTGWIWRPAIEELTQRTERANEQMCQLESYARELGSRIQNDQTAAQTYMGETRKRLETIDVGIEMMTDRLDSMDMSFGTFEKQSRELEGRIEELKSEIEKLENKIERSDDEIENLEHEIEKQDELIEQNGVINGRIEKYANDLGAVARQTMLAKWKVIDHLLPDIEKPDDMLTCVICGASHMRNEYETRETECVFNGGHLVRYVCPECGAIFGPTKFTAQGQKGIDEDYWVHYLGFSEGDSSYKEERAFFMLKPERGKAYLNYGCGRWSRSLQKLRELGYDVYGYEPYAPEEDNPYLITDRDKLAKMRFDGIYSNDLLEHLPDPVEDLRFMRSLLLQPGGAMAHCTACYVYRYEFTRFHTVFFTGRSREIMAQKAGLEITEVCDDLAENDFICCVYRPVESDPLWPKMFMTENAFFVNHDAHLETGGKIYGPYLDLPAGAYIIQITTDADGMELSVTADVGREQITQEQLVKGVNRIRFDLDELRRDIEFVTTCHDNSGNVGEIRLERASE